MRIRVMAFVVSALLCRGAVAQVMPVHGEAFVYDAARQRVVLFGGGTPASGPLRGTWEFDGSRWLMSADSASSPSPRSGHTLGFDPDRRRVMLTGGMHGPPLRLFCDTWEYDGSSWRQLDAGTRCVTERVRNASLLYDHRRSAMLLLEGPAVARDTARPLRIWRWHESAWQLIDSVGPRRVGFSAAAWDEDRSVLVVPVLFGGPDAGTWEWDGRRWTRHAHDNVATRQTYGLSWDSRLRRVVLAGGQGRARGPYYDDFWTWDGARWSALPQGSVVPPGRGGGWLLDDVSGGRLIYLSGYNEAPLADLWFFAGGSWWPFTR